MLAELPVVGLEPPSAPASTASPNDSLLTPACNSSSSVTAELAVDALDRALESLIDTGDSVCGSPKNVPGAGGVAGGGGGLAGELWGEANGLDVARKLLLDRTLEGVCGCGGKSSPSPTVSSVYRRRACFSGVEGAGVPPEV